MANLNLKISTLEVRTSPTKGDYAYAKGVIQKKDGTVTSERTIMSFGPQFEAVRDILVANSEVTVSAVFNDGVIKVLGMPVAPKAKAA